VTGCPALTSSERRRDIARGSYFDYYFIYVQSIIFNKNNNDVHRKIIDNKQCNIP